ncbi:MAG: MaoC/PaaZ C-terminal domain-containing protein [Acidimicrobiia bacterium]|nr:MaoC/PaaZ C-terminal domain-containing protein [Acidimicrobiia bacterium]
MTTEGFTPADLLGHTIGPVTVAVTPDSVAAYVAATRDDPERWVGTAPPGFGSVLLFSVADSFLYDPRIVEYTTTLMHVDQTFTYPSPVVVPSDQIVTGTITRVRERGGSFFVTFEATAVAGGETTVESISTFLLSSQQASPPDSERVEPAVRASGVNGSDGNALLRSVSRSDLVRYAAASRDFNPFHWDHESAVGAGMPGVVVHGLLMYAWAMQGVNLHGSVVSAKVRFRNALFPAEQATVMTDVGGDQVNVVIARDGEQLMTGTATVVPDAE